DNVEVATEVLPIAEARAKGAMAIFEEKYGDTVRVLSMRARRHASVELCGGTHARRTGDLGLFRVASDKAIAAGVRRIEATTGFNSWREAREIEGTLTTMVRALNADAQSAQGKLEKLIANERALEKKVAELERSIALGGASGGGGVDGMIAGAKSYAGFKALAVKNTLGDAGALRDLADKLRDKLAAGGEAVVMIAGAHAGKASLVVTVSKALSASLKAGAIVGAVASHVGGKGGGRPDMAMAGGPNVEGIDAAIEAFYGQIAAHGASQ
ncbi:MAG: DHHA1 domain-containing protein, partial [Polyangiales bacterium]